MKFRIIRNKKVITDIDLADALGMQSKVLIAFYKRNASAFAREDVFNLTQEEQQDFIRNYCSSHKERLRYAKRLPYIFTQRAVIQMLFMRPRCAVAKSLREKFLSLPEIAKIDLEGILR
ncbi:MAG: ORF6N domain-containing protein [Elusimicrobiota bacterium]|jgi:C4-dicarboxylate-specific signal transduction histidine kinase|nr:ORF6N domain-containing protein [Elusimicrobiota bacterium]